MLITQNAIIKSATLSSADHGCLSGFLHLELANGGGQGFGGYMLYSPSQKLNQNYAGHWIWRCMEIVNVTEWSLMKGKHIRVVGDWGMIYKIGNIMEDRWFDPKEEFIKMENMTQFKIGKYE